MASEQQPSASTNLEYVEAMYEQFLADPDSVSELWRREFMSWNGHGKATPATGTPMFAPRSIFSPAGLPPQPTATPPSGAKAQPPSPDGSPITPASDDSPEHYNVIPSDRQQLLHPVQVETVHRPGEKPKHDKRTFKPTNGQARSADDISSLQHRVDQLIRNYRVRGHMIADINPLGFHGEPPDELRLDYYGFSEADIDRPLLTTTIPGSNQRTLREIIDIMQSTYCQAIGVQFMHIDSLRVREWLQNRMESTRNTTTLSRKEQIRILTRLTDAVIFEQFIQKKFIGAKSFSLEGAETLIPMLDLCFETAGGQGVREVVIAMAHRGRLNVLANIIGKSPQRIFREFEDIDPKLYLGGGDVKYHLGYSGDWRTRKGKNIHLSLCFNPSHLEFVNPVALGRMRAKQDRSPYETRGDRGLCVLIHGDAAFAGEGVVQETLNLSQLPGYTVGGALHIIVNNQLGFTTPPHQGRSTSYATDVAKMLQSPIFHVNGENPEAVAQTIRLAMEFRMTFKRDVVIDMYGYRRRGHNEGDEPGYTQPRMYRAIENRPNVRESYLARLKELGGVSDEDANHIIERRTELLEKELTAARSESFQPRKERKPTGLWEGFIGGLERDVDEVKTGVDQQRLAGTLEKLTQVPDDFHVHPKLKRQLKQRLEMAKGKRSLDWAACEALALGSLAVDGHRVRVSGQDSQRGTFSHRHSVLHDVENSREFMPLNALDPKQAYVEIVNSPLSEAGVLGFEYGYSLDLPSALTIWEAQFGDFVNAAQVIIDQFICSAEDKWRRLSGLVVLLPHGFEGQGPEHSSARLERLLMLCAEDNMQVCNPTSPAQFFHLLRRQVIRGWRKPLFVLTPKSLLRHPKVVSELDDLSTGTFKRVLDDQGASQRKKVSRVILCSGKVYYDLIQRREELGRDDVAILRLEQYYPFPMDMLRSALARYADGTPCLWVQEEPDNMGAWPFLKNMFCNRMMDRMPLSSVTRAHSASPATGSRAAHQMEQDRLLARAFGEG